MKGFIVILLFAVTFEYAFAVTSLQSFYGILGFENHLSAKLLVGNRFKRSADLVAALCMQQCGATMKNRMDDETSLNLKTVSNGLVNRQLFEDENFADFCGIYNEGRMCIDNCGDFPLKHIIHNVLKPIDYMCVVRYNEFQKYIPCLSEGAEIVADTCDDQCGGTGYAAESLGKMRQVTQIQDTVRLMSEMCSHIRCSLDCELELYAEVCESETPADLLRDFTRVAMRQSQRIMKQAKVDHLFPGKCRQLVKDLGKEHKERKEAEKAIRETQSEMKALIGDEFEENDEQVDQMVRLDKKKYEQDPFLF